MGGEPAQGGGKFELWDGDVVVTHGPAGFESAERSEHWEAKGAMYRALHDAIRRAGLACFVSVDRASVRLSNSRLAQPDVLVYAAARWHAACWRCRTR